MEALEIKDPISQIKNRVESHSSGRQNFRT
jgi:hypothetical protein